VFDSKSRYASLEDASIVDNKGRVITYKKRRFLPRGEEMLLLVEVTIAQGDRLDLIASRTLGDPEQFWRICDACNAMNPSELSHPGRTLRVSLPQF